MGNLLPVTSETFVWDDEGVFDKLLWDYIGEFSHIKDSINVIEIHLTDTMCDEICTDKSLAIIWWHKGLQSMRETTLSNW